MSEEWKRDLETSQKRMIAISPVLCILLRGGEILSVENKPDPVCKMLDIQCGIDYFHHISWRGNNDIVRGIAARMQQCIKRNGEPYNTFTIRESRENGSKTEMDKRIVQIEKDGVYPYYTCQAYFHPETNELLSIGVIKTTDLYDALSKNFEGYRRITANDGKSARAIVIPWDDLCMKEKKKMRIYKNGGYYLVENGQFFRYV